MFANQISKNLWETDQGLEFKGFKFQMLNPYAVTTIFEEIDLRTPEDRILMYTMDSGRQFYPIKLDFIVRQINRTSKDRSPLISLGFLSPTYDQLLSNYDLGGLTQVKQYQSELLGGVRMSADANKPLVLRKNRVSDKIFTISVRLIGYYY